MVEAWDRALSLEALTTPSSSTSTTRLVTYSHSSFTQSNKTLLKRTSTFLSSVSIASTGFRVQTGTLMGLSGLERVVERTCT